MQSKDDQFPGYIMIKALGKGTFGTVYLVKNKQDKLFAIKHVFEDKRYKNRQLEITAKLNHPNIVKLEDKYHQTINNKLYLNLVLEYLPETLSQKVRICKIGGSFIPNDHLKKYVIGLLKGLEYLKKINVCHRDIKPSNILIGLNQQIKLCDFGSAKSLIEGQKNIAYICSRYYRAPQLIFGSINYTNQVDMWSVGCVIAQMIINKPIFQGQNSLDQLAKIMKILGTPTKRDIIQMKAKQLTMQLPVLQPISLKKYLTRFNRSVDLQLIDLLQKIFVYDPTKRITPSQALKDPYLYQSKTSSDEDQKLI